jgi:dihydrofolate synthase/folylpolyglutamate synthase
MTYTDALAFWYGRMNYEVRSATPADLKLERMRALLKRLNDPQERFRSVHITGTKGKGSTAAMLSAILQASGYRVGLFTSPHLCHVEERTQINNVPISPAELSARMAEIADAVHQLGQTPFPPPTFFEIGTALGFLHFAYRRVDVAVVEVGLGGRFDSTNVIRPLVSVITSVGLDHMAQLGNSLEAIAYQKAGIIKSRVPVISGVTDEGPRRIIQTVAAEMNAPLDQLDRDFRYRYSPGDPPSAEIMTRCGDTGQVRLKLLGEHQAANAAVAVAAVERLRTLGLTIPRQAVAAGLSSVDWPARVEVVSRHPIVILDTAHNTPSIIALVKTLRETFRPSGRRRLVFAVSHDKAYSEMLAQLAEYFDEFHFCRYDNARSVSPEVLAACLHSLASGRSIQTHDNSRTAWRVVRSQASPQDLIAITGSVFLAGELMDMIRS